MHGIIQHRVFCTSVLSLLNYFTCILVGLSRGVLNRGVLSNYNPSVDQSDCRFCYNCSLNNVYMSCIYRCYPFYGPKGNGLCPMPSRGGLPWGNARIPCRKFWDFCSEIQFGAFWGTFLGLQCLISSLKFCSEICIAFCNYMSILFV